MPATSIAAALNKRRKAASRAPAGLVTVNVDSFYNVSHGVDDGISIRLAVASALTHNAAKIVFSNKTYNLVSSVGILYDAYNFFAFIEILKPSWMDYLELEGNGAVLERLGDGSVAADFPHILRVRAAVRRLTIRGLHFKRNLNLYNFVNPGNGEPWNESNLGLSIVPHVSESLPNRTGAYEIDQILIENCIFTDCHRSLQIANGFFPASLLQSRGKLKSVIIRGCQLLYPKGSNYTAPVGGYYGGGQGSFFDHWIKDLWLDGCHFDGATTGTYEGTGFSPPVDGMFIGGGLSTRATNCTHTHYDFEGFYFTKPGWDMGSDGFTPTNIPAIGQTVEIKMYRWSSLMGLESDATRGAGNGDVISLLQSYAYPGVITHTFRVLSVSHTPVEAPFITCVVLTGVPTLRTGPTVGLPIRHQNLDLEVYGEALDNYFYEAPVTQSGNELGVITVKEQEPYTAIEFIGVDRCTAIGNRVRDITTGIGSRDNRSVWIEGNDISASQTGITQMNPDDVNTTVHILNNNIELIDANRWATGRATSPLNAQRGIQVRGRNTNVRGNSVTKLNHSTSPDFSAAVYMTSNVSAAIVAGNTFTGTRLDVENENFVNLHYAYFDNIRTNVQITQTRYPEIYANDQEAEVASYPGPVPVGGIYTLPDGSIAYVGPPTLSAQSAASPNVNEIIGLVTTNEGNGTLYGFLSTSATPPSSAALIAGTGAVGHVIEDVIAAGVNQALFFLLDPDTYYVHFLHRDAAGNSSAIVSSGAVVVGVVVPPSGATITLNGNDLSIIETGFRDEKSTISATGAWTTLGTRAALAGIGDPYSVDYDGQPFNTRIWARSVPFNGLGDGEAYPAIELVTRPDELPTAFTATADGAYALDLSWTPPTVLPLNGGYRISRYNGTGYEELDSVPVGTNTYKHSGLLAESEHLYRITCFNTNGNSSFSVMPTYASATGETAASPYVIEADFETGNIERGIDPYWTTTSGTVTFNYPDSTLWAGKCVQIATSSYFLTNFAGSASLTTMYAFVAAKITGSNAHFAFGGIRLIVQSDGTVWAGEGGNLYVVSGSFSGGSPHAGGAVCFFWIDYSAGDNEVTVIISATAEKPTPTAANSVTLTHASFNDPATFFFAEGPCLLDHVRVSSSPIGDFPI